VVALAVMIIDCGGAGALLVLVRRMPAAKA